MNKADCPHLDQLKDGVKSTKTACEVCGEQGNLRICQTCGFVGCCESHLAHDTEHFQKTGHPFIRPLGAEDAWLWCYKCRAYLN